MAYDVYCIQKENSGRIGKCRNTEQS